MHVYIYIYACTYIYICMYIFEHVQSVFYICTHILERTYIHECVHARIRLLCQPCDCVGKSVPAALAAATYFVV